MTQSVLDIQARMADIEAIKQLKARYLRLLDQGQWDAFAELFTADVEQSWTPAPGEEPVGSKGRDAVVSNIRSSVE